MKKRAKKVVTKAKLNQVQTRRRELSVGELEQAYGGGLVDDQGTKDG